MMSVTRLMALRVSVFLALLTTLGMLALSATANAQQREQQVAYTYTVEQRGNVRGDLGRFAAVARQALGHSRGWSLNGVINFVPVESGGSFRLILASPEEVDRAHPVCSAQYSCRVGDQVLINDQRWRQKPAHWGGTQAQYQRYIINHEVGHWLGLGHWSCSAAGRQAPVMQQQSISLQGCQPNVWPLEREKQAVADYRGLRYGDDQAAEPQRNLLLTWPYMTGGDVREWQQFLRRQGYRNTAGQPLTVDGIYGPETERATRLFQRDANIQVDGIVGPVTRRAAGL